MYGLFHNVNTFLVVKNIPYHIVPHPCTGLGKIAFETKDIHQKTYSTFYVGQGGDGKSKNAHLFCLSTYGEKVGDKTQRERDKKGRKAFSVSDGSRIEEITMFARKQQLLPPIKTMVDPQVQKCVLFFAFIKATGAAVWHGRICNQASYSVCEKGSVEEEGRSCPRPFVCEGRDRPSPGGLGWKGKARRANARELVGARRSLPSSPGPLIYGMQSFFLKWGGGKRMEKKEKGGK